MLAIKNQWHDNVTSIIFGSGLSKSDDDMLVEALEDKYNIIREKLFTEVGIQFPCSFLTVVNMLKY